MTIETCIKAAKAELAAAQTDILDALNTEKSRRRGPLVQRLHEVRQMLSPAYRYTSQAGQDEVVDRLLGRKVKGVFLDIGGYDGITGSNTLFLEVFRGWTGLLIEPAPPQLELARGIRRCRCLGVAVAPEDGEAEFIEVQAGLTQMSGLSATYDPGLLDRVRADPRHKEMSHLVPTRKLESLIEEVGTTEPDLVSLDIEGGELSVLEAFDFDTYRPHLWCIENNLANRSLPLLMRRAGYDLIEFCGPDEVYLDRRVG